MATPRPKARVKIEGIKELQARMKHPRLVMLPFQDMLRKAAFEGREAAQEPLDVATGAARRTIFANYPKGVTGKQALSASVSSLMAREVSMSIDKGRKVGAFVPFKSLANWITGRPPASRLWLNDMTPEERGLVFKIRLLIHAQGTKGKKFRDAAKKKVQEVLPGLRAGLDAEIERRWGGFTR